MSTVLIFSVTLFLSAFLLFSVQPMFAKMILPIFGGAPHVWNTCLCFFQVSLLAGYYYAHIISKGLRSRTQILMHIALLLLALFYLPISVLTYNTAPYGTHPLLWLISLLTINIGLPFFIISANSPLIQRWFSLLKHRNAKDPYFLYAVSNAASLCALFSYPILIEPYLTLTQQSRAWFYCYLALVLFILSCGVILLRSAEYSSEDRATPKNPDHVEAAHSGNHLHKKLRWLFLSFVPSSLIYGVTTFISTDIAAIPLFWVLPLSIYLLTFIFGFSRRFDNLYRWSKRAFPVVVVILAVTILFGPKVPLLFSCIWHLFSFFVIAMYCHGELARGAPQAQDLTSFYLWLSFGGALGGIWNALLAPVIFPIPLEYPITIISSCVLWTDMAIVKRVFSRWAYFILPVGFWLLFLAFIHLDFFKSVNPNFIIRILCYALIFALFIFSLKYRILRGWLSAGFVLMLWVYPINPMGVIYSKRSFFGVHRIKFDKKNQLYMYMNGNTVHGIQSLQPQLRMEPTTYYHKTGPLGSIFNLYNKKQPSFSIGAIGLGIGSVAAYTKENQRLDFYEIDPIVKTIAADLGYFTFLRDCKAPYRVILGDGRLSIQKAPDHQYGLLIEDAFNSDAIPVHIITKEAFRLYLQKLHLDGIMAFHISNNYLDLEPVFGDLAEASQLVSLTQYDIVDEKSEFARTTGKQSSIWVVMARKPSDLGELYTDSRWQPTRTSCSEEAVWTDNFSNIFSVFRLEYVPGRFKTSPKSLP